MSPSDPTATDVTGGLPYTLTGKGRVMSVVQSSQWLPISVPPAVIVPVPVAVVYPVWQGVAVAVAVGVGLAVAVDVADGLAVGVGPTGSLSVYAFCCDAPLIGSRPSTHEVTCLVSIAEP